MAKDLGSLNDIRLSGEVDKQKNISDAKQVQEESTSKSPLENLLFGLPGREQAETDIALRSNEADILKSSYSDLIKDPGFNVETAGDVFNTMMSGGQLALDRTLGVGASGALGLMDVMGNDSSVGDVGKDMIKQLTGKRTVRMNDLFRAKLPKVEVAGYDITRPVAFIGGLGTEGMFSLKTLNAVKNLSKGDRSTFKSIQGLADAAEGTAKDLGAKIGEAMKSGLGKKHVQMETIMRAMDDLPESVSKKIFGEKGKKIYGVVRDDVTGFIDNTVENVWKLRRALEDTMGTRKFQQKTTTMATDLYKKSIKAIRSQVNSDPKVAKLMDDFSDYKMKLNDFQSEVMTRGKVSMAKLRSAYKRGGEPRVAESIDELAKVFPKVQSITEQTKALGLRNAVIEGGVGLSKAVILGGILAKFLRGNSSNVSTDSRP